MTNSLDSQNSQNKHPSFPSSQKEQMESYEEGKETREKQIAKNSGKVQRKKKKSPSNISKSFYVWREKEMSFPN